MAVLNYVPIFAILFSLVAVLEDVGYVPRMAFIMDRIFRRFGLHGQSVFPMVLGGVVVGGCAIPAIMATRGMKDQRARLATILIIPLLNCLAKTPLHILLIEMFYSEHRAFAVVFISTVSLVIALTVSKILSLTALRSQESAPFVMEMPPYHMPTISGVFQRCWERLWLFLRKITSVVLAVMVVVFALTSLPGLGLAQKQAYYTESDRMVRQFRASVGDDSRYADILADTGLVQLVRYSNEFDLAKKAAGSDARLSKVRQNFADRNPDFYIALISSLAAKESSVATLGGIYGLGSGARLEESVAESDLGWTDLHALALMVFMVVFPPCIPTLLAVKMETGSTIWTLFAGTYPILLGLLLASLIFTGGRALGLSGIRAMTGFYATAIIIMLALSTIREPSEEDFDEE